MSTCAPPERSAADTSGGICGQLLIAASCCQCCQQRLPPQPRHCQHCRSCLKESLEEKSEGRSGTVIETLSKVFLNKLKKRWKQSQLIIPDAPASFTVAQFFLFLALRPDSNRYRCRDNNQIPIDQVLPPLNHS